MAPVGEGVRFLQFLSEDPLDQGGIPNLCAISKQGGRDLCIENGLEKASDATLKQINILTAGMHDFHHSAIVEESPQRIQGSQGRHVNHGTGPLCRNLD